MTRRILSFSVFFLTFFAVAGCAAETAKSLLGSAMDTASHEQKKVLVVFHASWCGWCKKLDVMLSDSKVGPLMNSHFVIAHVDVLEDKETASLNTPGGVELMESFGGKSPGLPFFAITDAQGRLLLNSLRQPGDKNIGYPTVPEEIDWFMKMVRESAPGLSRAEGETIERWLVDHAH